MDLHLDLADAPGRSLRARLEHALREGVRSGRLAPDTRLPSTRDLCTELGVSRGVVVDAYAQLAAEGYLRTRRGGGTTVAPSVARETGRAPSAARAPAVRYDLSPYRPALSELPRRELAAALARVLRVMPDGRMGVPDPAGTIELRTAIASYLGRARGVQASAERVVITAGVRHGVGMVWRALVALGVRRIGIERPGWRGIRETASAAGLTCVPLRVDEDGLVLDGLAAQRVDAVAVAPAHQYPSGAVLSTERRRVLLEWARTHGGLVIEDDFDAEYRYDHQPIGSLQGLAPDHVVYGGSTSKTVAPSLRVGWLVVPARLVQPIVEVQEVGGTIASPLLQLAFADMIERGELDRHLRRQRRALPAAPRGATDDARHRPARARGAGRRGGVVCRARASPSPRRGGRAGGGPGARDRARGRRGRTAHPRDWLRGPERRRGRASGRRAGGEPRGR